MVLASSTVSCDKKTEPLSFVGDKETTEPVFRKILEKVNNDTSKGYMRHAIRVLNKRDSWGRWAYYLYSEDRDDPARERQ